MNVRLIAKLLGAVSYLIGATMIFSLPWAWPVMTDAEPGRPVETRGFMALVVSMVVCWIVGALLRRWGRDAKINLFRKEAMAIVGLSWVLATILGALPFLISGTCRGWEVPPDGDVPGVPLDLPLHERVADWLFESQSGFSTTGATILTKIESPILVPRCILFWRSSTHFLGGLGIIVLFVAVLGQGSAGKAMMRAEMPGPSKDGAMERMQHTAWVFAAIYCGLNAILAVALWLEGMSVFDALCHAMGTLATGGFSTYDSSLGHFNSPLIEYTVVLFMLLAGTNFTLLYLLLLRQPGKLWADFEWRTYVLIIAGVTAGILIVSMGFYHDFNKDGSLSRWEEFGRTLRFGLFQVVSIVTTTGFGTHNFDVWHSFGRGALFLIMFIGGCAGSTGGGMKVIRHILFVKILRLEVEQSYRPTVVRHVRLGNEVITDPDLRKNILVYFGLILAIFVYSWMALVIIEPDETWLSGEGQTLDNKLIDSASAIAATLNNIGPGLGIVGATENYAGFTAPSKILFIFLMMLGRLELFAILVLFVPSFWRSR